jgi:seryl-tRNA synthetase
VTGDKAKEHFAVLTPVMDFEEKLGNFQEIEENIQRRKLSINLENIQKEWQLYQTIQQRKKNIEQRRADIAKQMRESPNDGLKIEGKQLRDDLKLLKENSYYLEDQFANNFLSLPNKIHPKTTDEEQVLFEHLERPGANAKRLDLSDLVEYIDEFSCYLKGEAALFDTYCPMYITDFFKSQEFIQFSNPDFARTVIAEGAGSNPDNLFLLKEENVENKLNLLHLTGKASIYSFLGFITKLSVFPSYFPLKFVTYGKQYSPSQQGSDLYSLVQNTCVQLFISILEESKVDDTVEELTESYFNLYKKFNQHFRIIRYPAHRLDRSESLRIGVEMFSNSKDSYVEVGSLSVHGDFISKRLLFNCRDGKNFRYPQIVSGTVVDVSKLLIVLLENSDNEFKCPRFLINK